LADTITTRMKKASKKRQFLRRPQSNA
jgi:hypothetical protein